MAEMTARGWVITIDYHRRVTVDGRRAVLLLIVRRLLLTAI